MKFQIGGDTFAPDHFLHVIEVARLRYVKAQQLKTMPRTPLPLTHTYTHTLAHFLRAHPVHTFLRTQQCIRCLTVTPQRLWHWADELNCGRR